MCGDCWHCEPNDAREKGGRPHGVNVWRLLALRAEQFKGEGVSEEGRQLGVKTWRLLALSDGFCIGKGVERAGWKECANG
eukprot:366136-Chlamydomonas_euryale.AAC.5